MPNELGHWTQEDHLHPANQADDPGLAQAYVDMFADRHKVLDFGCGKGFYLKKLKAAGHETTGIEPNSMGDLWGDGEWIVADIFSQDFKWNDERQFDLVICTEVAEHTDRKNHDKLFNFITGMDHLLLRPPMMVFSGAIPGQGGCGHCAERPEAEWIEELRKRGYYVHPDLTKEIRSRACNGYFRNNLLVLYYS